MPALLLAAVLAGGAPAGAAVFALNVEFDGNGTGDFGSLDVNEVGGDLVFTITAGPDLGPEADLQSFYFNLTDPVTGPEIAADDAPISAYSLLSELFPTRSVQGGAGAAFDVGVGFGNGAGAAGNFTLQTATFTLSADQSLSVADLFEVSSTNNAGRVNFAAHFQSTDAFRGSDSETVGGVVPEPSTALLFALGLAPLVMVRRQWAKRHQSHTPTPSNSCARRHPCLKSKRNSATPASPSPAGTWST